MRTETSVRIVIGSLVVFLGAGLARGQDWPQWLGPNRDGKASDFKAPTTWPKELAQKWKVEVGNGDSGPSLVGDKLFVFARQGGDEILRCMDAATGKEVWQEKYESKGATPPAAGPHEGPRSTPTVVDGKVVTLGVRGILSCVDAATGKKVWRQDQFQAWPMFYTSSSPIVVDGLCIAQLGGSKNGAIVAYDVANGEQKWSWTGDGPAYASPVLVTVDDAKLVVAETEKKIVALTVAGGKLAWEAPFAAQRMAYNAATPVVSGSTIIYSGVGRGTKAVKLEKQGDRIVAKELWDNKDTTVQFNTPVLKDGHLYGLTLTNELFCINSENGKTAWTAPAIKTNTNRPAGASAPGAEAGKAGQGKSGRGMRGGMRGGGYASIIDAGSVLLALTPASELIVFLPNDKKYTELARIKVAPTPTYAYPVVSGNRLFVKDADAITLWTVN